MTSVQWQHRQQRRLMGHPEEKSSLLSCDCISPRRLRKLGLVLPQMYLPTSLSLSMRSFLDGAGEAADGEMTRTSGKPVSGWLHD